MKRRRRLFKGMAAISLVLCALTVPAWLLSRWLFVDVRYVRPEPPAIAPSRLQYFSIGVIPGGIGIWAVTLAPLNAADVVLWANPSPVPRGISLNYRWSHFRRTRWGEWKADYRVSGPQPGSQVTTIFHGVDASANGVYVHVPFWMMTVAFGILPGLKLLRWRTERRRTCRGLCAICGYDVRATPERCPECGTVPESTKGAAI